jgi:hypothetical protein
MAPFMLVVVAVEQTLQQQHLLLAVMAAAVMEEVHPHFQLLDQLILAVAVAETVHYLILEEIVQVQMAVLE